MSSEIFAKMVDRDLGKFPGHIGEIISAFKSFQNGGWGKGFSGRHLAKIIARDETVFSTTWAELRREYFRELRAKIFPSLNDVRIPLPRNGRDRNVLSDKEIREKVQAGYRLMFCPITKISQLADSPIFPRSKRFCFLRFDQDDWRNEVENNLSMTANRPYWFWIGCDEMKGEAYFSADQFEATAPTLVEYLIADFVLRDEMGRHIDEEGCTFLNHRCEDSQYMVLGGNPIKEISKKKTIDFGRAYAEADGSRFPIYSRKIIYL